MNRRHEVVVVGGGLSGLAAAIHRFAQPGDRGTLEADSAAGEVGEAIAGTEVRP